MAVGDDMENIIPLLHHYSHSKFHLHWRLNHLLHSQFGAVDSLFVSLLLASSSLPLAASSLPLVSSSAFLVSSFLQRGGASSAVVSRAISLSPSLFVELGSLLFWQHAELL